MRCPSCYSKDVEFLCASCGLADDGAAPRDHRWGDNWVALYRIMRTEELLEQARAQCNRIRSWWHDEKAEHRETFASGIAAVNDAVRYAAAWRRAHDLLAQMPAKNTNVSGPEWRDWLARREAFLEAGDP